MQRQENYWKPLSNYAPALIVTLPSSLLLSATGSTSTAGFCSAPEKGDRREHPHRGGVQLENSRRSLSPGDALSLSPCIALLCCTVSAKYSMVFFFCFKYGKEGDLNFDQRFPIHWRQESRDNRGKERSEELVVFKG